MKIMIGVSTSFSVGRDSLMNAEDERLMAGRSRDTPSVVELETGGEDDRDEERREEARRTAAEKEREKEEEARKEKERAEKEEADRARTEKAKSDREKKKEDRVRAEKEKADREKREKAERDKAERARVEKEKDDSAMSEIKRKLAELQAKLDGNRLDARKTPPRSVSPPARVRTRQERMSSTDYEEQQYREDRYRSERDRRGRFRSESPRRGRGQSPYTMLGVEGRPSGMSRERINGLGVDACLSMKGWQREDEARRATELGRPGKRVLEVSKPRAAVEVKAMLEDEADNGSTRLSAARWLRPPESATDWWRDVPLGWDEGEGQHWSEYSGTRDSMPSGTFHSHAEGRDIYLPSKVRRIREGGEWGLGGNNVVFLSY